MCVRYLLAHGCFTVPVLLPVTRHDGRTWRQHSHNTHTHITRRSPRFLGAHLVRRAQAEPALQSVQKVVFSMFAIRCWCCCCATFRARARAGSQPNHSAHAVCAAHHMTLDIAIAGARRARGVCSALQCAQQSFRAKTLVAPARVCKSKVNACAQAPDPNGLLKMSSRAEKQTTDAGSGSQATHPSTPVFCPTPSARLFGLRWACGFS